MPNFASLAQVTAPRSRRFTQAGVLQKSEAGQRSGGRRWTQGPGCPPPDSEGRSRRLMKTLPDLLPGRFSWRGCAVAITVAGTLLAPLPAAAQTDTFGCVTPPEDMLHLEV